MAAHASETSGGRRLRILMVVPSPVGGTIQYSHNLCNAMADAGHGVTMATALGYELGRFPRRYHAVEVFDRFRPRPVALWRFARAVMALRPDVIHFQGAQRPEFYLLVRAVLNTLTAARFVWTPQDVLSNSHKPWHLRLMRYLYGKMAHIFLNARQNLDVVTDLFRFPADRVTVLPIPDLVAFARDDLKAVPPPEMVAGDAPLILCFGLIEERKGIGTLIDAFARLRARGAEARLVIMGKPLTDVAPFAGQLAAAGLGEAAQMIPRYASFEEMNALFGAAHHVVLPYHNGWNSGVLASAYGYGKPVIATTVGGFDEAVGDGASGLLVPPRDADALADAMARMLDDPALYARLAEGAVARREVASWARVADETLAVYDRVLGRAS